MPPTPLLPEALPERGCGASAVRASSQQQPPYPRILQGQQHGTLNPLRNRGSYLSSPSGAGRRGGRGRPASDHTADHGPPPRPSVRPAGIQDMRSLLRCPSPPRQHRPHSAPARSLRALSPQCSAPSARSCFPSPLLAEDPTATKGEEQREERPPRGVGARRKA